jgi:hypothetical protein
MPWKVGDVDDHMKGLSPSEKETWVEVANKALAACEKAGRTDCDASAIKQANAVLGKVREALTANEAEFVEAATFKALIQGLIRSAGGVANHKGVPAALKKRLTDLRSMLTKTYKAMGEEDGDVPESATEATGGPSLGIDEFAETGDLLEVANG